MDATKIDEDAILALYEHSLPLRVIESLFVIVLILELKVVV